MSIELSFSWILLWKGGRGHPGPQTTQRREAPATGHTLALAGEGGARRQECDRWDVWNVAQGGGRRGRRRQRHGRERGAVLGGNCGQRWRSGRDRRQCTPPLSTSDPRFPENPTEMSCFYDQAEPVPSRPSKAQGHATATSSNGHETKPPILLHQLNVFVALHLLRHDCGTVYAWTHTRHTQPYSLPPGNFRTYLPFPP